MKAGITGVVGESLPKSTVTISVAVHVGIIRFTTRRYTNPYLDYLTLPYHRYFVNSEFIISHLEALRDFFRPIAPER